MKIDYSRDFKKDFLKLNSKQQTQFEDRIAIFLNNPTHPRLRLHKLRGKYQDTFSINISGDLRALFLYEADTEVLLIRIGTHAQLYE